MDALQFQETGYEIVPGFLDPGAVQRLRDHAIAELQSLRGPVEYEADVGYPGAPKDRAAAGGNTPRRLLSACSRHDLWRELATSPSLRERLQPLLGEAPLLSQSHHNCVMTKHPGFSSATHWHQDIRYWSFDRPDLVSAWFALTEENTANGALNVVPGSHVMDFEPERFDEHLFLRPELAINSQLIDSAIPVELDPGDLLLFHCRTLHAAGKNQTDRVKLSAVFTYHGLTNAPSANTKSSLYPAIPF